MRSRPPVTRHTAIDAVDVLNEFIGDFITGVMVFREYATLHQAGRLPLDLMIGVQKMCLSTLVLAFAKFEEFWKHYHALVPLEHRPACKAVLKQIRDRKITDFRNRVVGHIWNADQQRPLRHSEIMQALSYMATQDLGAFLQWINNPRGNIYPNTVVSVMETVRDSIAAAHSVQPSEVVDR